MTEPNRMSLPDPTSLIPTGDFRRKSKRRSSILRIGEQIEKRNSRRVSWAETFQFKELLSDGTTVVTSQELNKYGPVQLPSNENAGLANSEKENQFNNINVKKVKGKFGNDRFNKVIAKYYNPEDVKDSETVVNTAYNKFGTEIESSTKNVGELLTLLNDNVVEGADLTKYFKHFKTSENNDAATSNCKIELDIIPNIDVYNSTAVHPASDQSPIHDFWKKSNLSAISGFSINFEDDDEIADCPESVHETTMMDISDENEADKANPEPVDDLSFDIDLSDEPAKTEVNINKKPIVNNENVEPANFSNKIQPNNSEVAETELDLSTNITLPQIIEDHLPKPGKEDSENRLNDKDKDLSENDMTFTKVIDNVPDVENSQKENGPIQDIVKKANSLDQTEEATQLSVQDSCGPSHGPTSSTLLLNETHATLNFSTVSFNESFKANKAKLKPEMPQTNINKELHQTKIVENVSSSMAITIVESESLQTENKVPSDGFLNQIKCAEKASCSLNLSKSTVSKVSNDKTLEEAAKMTPDENKAEENKPSAVLANALLENLNPQQSFDLDLSEDNFSSQSPESPKVNPEDQEMAADVTMEYDQHSKQLNTSAESDSSTKGEFITDFTLALTKEENQVIEANDSLVKTTATLNFTLALTEKCDADLPDFSDGKNSLDNSHISKSFENRSNVSIVQVSTTAHSLVSDDENSVKVEVFEITQQENDDPHTNHTVYEATKPFLGKSAEEILEEEMELAEIEENTNAEQFEIVKDSSLEASKSKPETETQNFFKRPLDIMSANLKRVKNNQDSEVTPANKPTISIASINSELATLQSDFLKTADFNLVPLPQIGTIRASNLPMSSTRIGRSFASHNQTIQPQPIELDFNISNEIKNNKTEELFCRPTTSRLIRKSLGLNIKERLIQKCKELDQQRQAAEEVNPQEKENILPNVEESTLDNVSQIEPIETSILKDSKMTLSQMSFGVEPTKTLPEKSILQLSVTQASFCSDEPMEGIEEEGDQTLKDDCQDNAPVNQSLDKTLCDDNDKAVVDGEDIEVERRVIVRVSDVPPLPTTNLRKSISMVFSDFPNLDQNLTQPIEFSDTLYSDEEEESLTDSIDQLYSKVCPKLEDVLEPIPCNDDRVGNTSLLQLSILRDGYTTEFFDFEQSFCQRFTSPIEDFHTITNAYSQYRFIEKMDFNALNVRVQSMDSDMLVLRFLWSTLELRIRFGSSVDPINSTEEQGQIRDIIAMDVISLLSSNRKLSTEVMNGEEDAPIYDGDSFFWKFDERHRPFLHLAREYVLTHFEEKQSFFKKNFRDSSKLPDLINEFSLIAQCARKLALELRILFSKEVVRILPRDSDGKFRISVEILALRKTLQLYFAFDPLMYPDEVIHPTIVVPEEDKHLYPLNEFSAALLMIKPCNFYYITNLITGANYFVRALRKVRAQTKRNRKQQAEILAARLS